MALEVLTGIADPSLKPLEKVRKGAVLPRLWRCLKAATEFFEEGNEVGLRCNLFWCHLITSPVPRTTTEVPSVVDVKCPALLRISGSDAIRYGIIDLDKRPAASLRLSSDTSRPARTITRRGGTFVGFTRPRLSPAARSSTLPPA